MVAAAQLNNRATGPLAIVGTLTMIATAITGVLRARMVWPARIDDQCVRLNGVGRAFLAELPTGY